MLSGALIINESHSGHAAKGRVQSVALLSIAERHGGQEAPLPLGNISCEKAEMKPQHGGIKDDRPILLNFLRLGNEFDGECAHGWEVVRKILTDPKEEAQVVEGRVRQQSDVLAQVAVHGRGTCGKGDSASANGFNAEGRVEFSWHLHGVKRHFICMPEWVPKSLSIRQVLKKTLTRKVTTKLYRVLKPSEGMCPPGALFGEAVDQILPILGGPLLVGERKLTTQCIV
jgi:hypothetical protein